MFLFDNIAGNNRKELKTLTYFTFRVYHSKVLVFHGLIYITTLCFKLDFTIKRNFQSMTLSWKNKVEYIRGKKTDAYKI